jgi:hypothetical protein
VNYKHCSLPDIAVIDKQPTSTTIQIENGSDFENKLTPSDIKLSSAMAMSAAAVSPYLGKNEESEQQLTHILTICGIEMGANIVYDMTGERSEHWFAQVRF